MAGVRRTRSHSPGSAILLNLENLFTDLKINIEETSIKSNKKTKILDIVANIEKTLMDFVAFQQTAKHRKYFFEKQPTGTSVSTPEIIIESDNTIVKSGKKKNKLVTIWKKKDDSNSASLEDTIRSKFKRSTNSTPALKHENKRDDSLYNLIEFLDKSLEIQNKPKNEKLIEPPTSPRGNNRGKKKSIPDGAVISSFQSEMENLIILPIKSSHLCAQLSGPDGSESEERYSNVTSAQTISTYPILNENGRSGDPICDRFLIQLHTKFSIVAVADGCNWGDRPREAAILACNEIISYLSCRIDSCKDTSDISFTLLKAFMHAHNKIISTKEGVRDPGTTTVLAGVLIKLESPIDGKDWIFVCASVGDCKGFYYSMKEKSFFEITIGNRQNVTDARDCGGRLGPADPINNLPDLRNLKVYSSLLFENDIITIVSDGVHDNLDPQLRGIPPSFFNMPFNDWTTAEANSPNEVIKIKSDFMIKIMNETVHATKSTITPHLITTSLIKLSKRVTKPCRIFMEKNPSVRQPSDYANYPGKMDHTTCVSIKVKTIPKHPFTTLSKVIETPIALDQFLKFIESIDLSNTSYPSFFPEECMEASTLNILIRKDLQFLEKITSEDLNTKLSSYQHFVKNIFEIYSEFILAPENQVNLSKATHKQMVEVCKTFIEYSLSEVEKRITVLFYEFQQSKWMKFQCFKIH